MGNLNTVQNTDEAASTGTSAGSGKLDDAMRSLRGVAEVIHGAGETIRGKTLAAVDQLGKDWNPQNEEIAEKGRLEIQRGLANLRGGQTSHGMQSASSDPTQPTYGSHAFGTSGGAAGSDKGGFQEGTTAVYGHGPESGLEGHPETTRGEYGVDPNYTTGKVRTTDGTGPSYPLGSGAKPYDAAGSTSSQGKQPYARTFGAPARQDYGAGNAGVGSMTHPGPSHHREDAVGAIPDKQLHEAQQTAYDHPYNTAHNRGVRSGSPEVYGNDPYQPSSEANVTGGRN